MSRALSAGSIVDAQCTRCKKITNHTIVAMVGEKIVRVECNTCHSTHNYRPLPTVKAPALAGTREKKAAPARTPKADPAAVAAAEWAALLANRDLTEAIPYDMQGTYRINNLVQHPRFGIGIVRLVLPNKIDVLFQEGPKRLLCG